MDPGLSKNLLPADGELYYFPGFYNLDEAQELFSVLQNEIAWEQQRIRIYGREHPEPRLTAWYGDPGAAYAYSGIKLLPKAWSPVLLTIKQKLEAACHAKFNSVLLNYYRDGRDSMGWHRDNERELGPHPVIASLSFGATRRFLVRRYRSNNEKLELPAESGSLILMRGDMQRHWEHSIPKQLKVTEGRINLTFRNIH